MDKNKKSRKTLPQTQIKQRLYNLVKKIPPGTTTTYKALAVKLKTSPRAIGNLLSKNYNPEIPCHRVICSNGSLGGYNRGIKKKLALLKKEKAI